MTIRKIKQAALTAIIALPLLLEPVAAGQLVYTPVNPSFGGNPLNGSYLFSKAQAGKKYSMDMNIPDFGRAPMLLAQAGEGGQETLIFQKDGKLYAYDVTTGTTRLIDFDGADGLPPGVLQGAGTGAVASEGIDAGAGTGSAGIDSGILQ